MSPDLVLTRVCLPLKYSFFLFKPEDVPSEGSTAVTNSFLEPVNTLYVDRSGDTSCGMYAVPNIDE